MCLPLVNQHDISNKFLFLVNQLVPQSRIWSTIMNISTCVIGRKSYMIGRNIWKGEKDSQKNKSLSAEYWKEKIYWWTRIIIQSYMLNNLVLFPGNGHAIEKGHLLCATRQGRPTQPFQQKKVGSNLWRSLHRQVGLGYKKGPSSLTGVPVNCLKN